MFGFTRGKLYTQVYSDAVLTEAWRKVKTGTAAAGVDNVTVARFEGHLFANLKALQEELRLRQYYPLPVKRIYVAKADGSKRPLGILAVRDRIVQRAVLEVIDPLFDQHFEECSHGFRKGRSVQTALAQVTRLVQQQRAWLVDLDIASFFEQINPTRLFKFIADTIRERELRRLIRAWLETETVVVERAGLLRREASRGILQGGVLSPLFANIYLDRFDKRALTRGLKLVRYGDDIVVCCHTQDEAEATLKRMTRLLAKLDLSVNPRKTAIFHAEKGFRFLGRQLALKATGTGEPRLAGWPPQGPRQAATALPATSSPSVSVPPADE